MEKEKKKKHQTEPKFINRELSWLAFNYRVLQEARDKKVPLLERIKFMAIFSSNLDEYFKVRVATLKRLVKLKRKTIEKLDEDPAETLNQVLEEVKRQQDEFGEVFREGILADLKKENIHLVTESELTATQKKFVTTYFKENLQPLLLPMVMDDTETHFFLKDQTVYLGVQMNGAKKDTTRPEQYAMLEVPTKKHGSRFIKLPTQKNNRYVMFIDDAIRTCLPLLFPEYSQFEAHAVKVSRDAELDIEEDISANLMTKIKKGLKKREIGTPARLLYDPETPQALLDEIMAHTGITDEELVEGSKYHNFRDFFGFPNFDLPELKYEPQPTLVHPLLKKEPSILAAMQKQDYIVHYPYQSFDYVVKLFNEAATDPAVTAISATLYRVADGSEIAKALTKAAKNGKLVTVVVELKARFDEESNIFWAGKLQKAGANVILGVPDLKVHSKLGLITRNENGKMVNYAYLSTGNYNEDTSKIYADHALFTCDSRLTKDVEQVFNFFIDRQPDKKFKHLLMAPINMRERFVELIEKEIKNAKKGLPASMILKMNALQDDRMIRKLYEASQAGVKIELLVRGICCLQPGIEGLSENITVQGIVDRYLEHARVYIFHNNGEEKYYVASADWMTRNLNRRVEVAFPLYQQDLIDQVRTIIDLQRSDNTKARLVDNSYVEKSATEETRSQYATYDYLRTLIPKGMKAERE
ncbi:polyphosphate kinase 1 [Pontibacter sp. BT310]|uniref:Polyphosphate kinase n=1 Tax=Pontibacter populi TaxID=890055 RepID=A0ABS6XFM4_9BACT|nr:MULTISPECIES: polyphosphate kinase 1 [Pontibacter]MBJ6119934.1 polyphosphate kinase 1 [Pontibacter sp. BT310]MBR0572363.1 polyphosphate kinase 1 [Microvirga sp. STS03]MBW3366787.1 polyphosphate kinase 1 [Pontibacter populi]